MDTNLTELLKNMKEVPSPENSKAFTDAIKEMTEDNTQVYTAVKQQGNGYAIDTAEHAGNVYVCMFSDSGMAKTKDGSKYATIGLKDLIKSSYANPHIMGIVINPYDTNPVFLQRKDLAIASGMEDPRMAKRDWGKGIPEYTESDRMVAEEGIDFAMEIVAEYGLQPEGYELVESNNGLTAFPNFVVTKDKKLYFVAVDAALAPNVPKLDPEVKEKLIQIGKEHGATVLYAPVSFSSADVERAAASLALVGDEYIGQFMGFIELN